MTTRTLTYNTAAAPANGALLRMKVNTTGEAEAALLPWDVTAALSSMVDDLEVGVALRFIQRFAVVATAICIDCGTAPTGANIVVNVKVAGDSILSTLPEIAAGETNNTTGSGVAAVINPTYEAIPAGAEVTVEITQIGSSVAGKNLNITILGNRT